MMIKDFLAFILRMTMIPWGNIANLDKSPKIFKEMYAAYSIGVGQRAYREKRYAKCFSVMKPIADYKISDPYVGTAQFLVGALYYHGLETEPDIDLAIKYFRLAASNGRNEAGEYLKKIDSSND